MDLLGQHLKSVQSVKDDRWHALRSSLDGLSTIEDEVDRAFVSKISAREYALLDALQEFLIYLNEKMKNLRGMLYKDNVARSRAKILHLLSDNFHKDFSTVIGGIHTELNAIDVMEYLKNRVGKVRVLLMDRIVDCVYEERDLDVHDFAKSVIRMVDAVCNVYNIYILPIQSQERDKLEERIRDYVKESSEILEAYDVKYIDILRAIKNDLSLETYGHEELLELYLYLDKFSGVECSRTTDIGGAGGIDCSVEYETPEEMDIRDDILESIIGNEDIVVSFIDELEGSYGSKVIKVSSLTNFVETVLGGSVEQQSKASNHYNVKITSILEGSRVDIFAHTLCFPHGKQEQCGLKTISELRKFIEVVGIDLPKYRELIERSKASTILGDHGGSLIVSEDDDGDDVGPLSPTASSEVASLISPRRRATLYP